MTPIAGPLVLLSMLLAAAVITYLVRRLALLAALVSALTTSALAILCLRLPLDRLALVLGREVAFGRPVVILGRTLVLDPVGQLWLAFVFVMATLFYLFAWRISQGHSFFPFTLAVLSLYTLAVLLQAFSLAVLSFSMGAVLLVFIIQAGQRGTVRGAQRYLVITLLAVPLLLGAAWLVEQFVLDAQNADMAAQALLPAALGFGLLLAVFPFGTWMPAVAADAPPIVAAFVFTVGQGMALFLALVFLRDSPFALSDQSVLSGIQLAGLLMAAIGGIMASAQRDFGRLFGYAALSDLGYLLLALGTGGSQSSTLALLHMLSRSASITLLASALAILRHWATTDRFAGLQGVAKRLPVATLGLMLGGLAMAGFPFTAGFPIHWAVSRAVWNWVQPFSPLAQESVAGLEAAPGQEWVWGLALIALVVSSLGIVIGLLRGLSAMLGTIPRDDIARQPVLASLMVLGLVALTIVLGLYPQFFLEPVQRAAQALSLF